MERDDLKIILNILYEMEGLVDMAIRRADETPAGVMCLIKEKSEMLHKYTSAWEIENDIDVNTCEDYSIDEEDALEANDNSESHLSDMNVGLNYQEPDDDIDVEFVYDESEEESEDNTEEETLIDEEPQEEQESTDVEKEVVESSLFDASAFSDEDSAEDELNNDVVFDNEQQDDVDDESEVLDEDEVVEEEAFIETKMVNANRQDIRKMFTINDRYRFRRELFCNNEVDFVDNLNLVQAMSCYEDAEDYFYNDLQWDSENEDVVEFMSIIFKYFNS